MTTWTGEIRAGDRIVFRVGRDEHGYVAEWPDTLLLRVDAEGRAPVFTPSPGADEDAVARLVNGLGAALVGHLGGGLALHMSVVAKGGIAIGCLGPSGAGKSTAAAALCSRFGWQLLRDDIAPIRREGDAAFVAPADAFVSLCPDGATALGLETGREQADGKIYVPCGAATGASRLRHIVRLTFDDGGRDTEPSLVRAPWTTAIAALVPSVVRLVIDEPERNAREMESLGWLYRAVQVHDLRRPRILDKLMDGLELIDAIGRCSGAHERENDGAT